MSNKLPTTPQQLFTEEEYEQFRELFERAIKLVPAFKEAVEWENHRYNAKLHIFGSYSYPGIRAVLREGVILTEYDPEEAEFKDGLTLPKEAFIYPAEYEMKIKRQNNERKAAEGLRNTEWRRQQYERLRKEFEGK